MRAALALGHVLCCGGEDVEEAVAHPFGVVAVGVHGDAELIDGGGRVFEGVKIDGQAFAEAAFFALANWVHGVHDGLCGERSDVYCCLGDCDDKEMNVLEGGDG